MLYNQRTTTEINDSFEDILQALTHLDFDNGDNKVSMTFDDDAGIESVNLRKGLSVID